MAKLDLGNIDDLSKAFREIGNVPNSVKEDALESMANIAKKGIKATGESMGVRDPESSVHILDNITTTKPKLTKEGGYSDITFKGTRPNGRKRVRNAEIAFIQEYGRRNAPARPFIGTAMSRNEKQIADAGGNVLGDWIEKTFQK